MGSILRIIVGIGVLIGAFIAKNKAAPSDQLDEEVVTTVTFGGAEMAASTLNMILVAFALVGAAMVLTGVIGLARRKS